MRFRQFFAFFRAAFWIFLMVFLNGLRAASGVRGPRRPPQRRQGKGNIDRYVARVPAGTAMFTIPKITAVPGQKPNFMPFKNMSRRGGSQTLDRTASRFLQKCLSKKGP